MIAASQSLALGVRLAAGSATDAPATTGVASAPFAGGRGNECAGRDDGLWLCFAPQIAGRSGKKALEHMSA